jgi:hypothetical protein
MVISIQQNGLVKTLYRDELRPILDALGSLSVERASTVEFDSGQWFVRRGRVNMIPTGFIKRSDAIRAEIEHLEREL